MLAITTVDMTTGTLNETAAHPREILRPAIVHVAYVFVLVHNLRAASQRLWTSTKAKAEWMIAGRKISRGCARDAFTVPLAISTFVMRPIAGSREAASGNDEPIISNPITNHQSHTPGSRTARGVGTAARRIPEANHKPMTAQPT